MNQKSQATLHRMETFKQCKSDTAFSYALEIKNGKSRDMSRSNSNLLLTTLYHYQVPVHSSKDTYMITHSFTESAIYVYSTIKYCINTPLLRPELVLC